MKHTVFLVIFFMMAFSACSQSSSNKTKNEDGKMRAESLKLLRNNSFSSNFNVCSKDGCIEITPFYGEISKKLDMSVKGHIVSYKGTVLKMELENSIIIEKKSFNEFNTTGTLFFLPFTEDEKELLAESKVKSVSLIDENKAIVCPVPENESDYFILLMKIDKEKSNRNSTI